MKRKRRTIRPPGRRFLYPAFLDLQGKPCLVVGGGSVALRKARLLIRCGARVTVVAPRAGPAFARLKNLRVRRRPFRAVDLAGKGRSPWLVVVATDDQGLNRRVARQCARRRLWVNVVDQPALCDFIVPSLVRRGPLAFAVSTGGASPALAKFVGKKLREYFGPEYGAMARSLQKMRPWLLKLDLRRRRRLLRKVLKESRLDRLRRRRPLRPGTRPLSGLIRGGF